MMYIVVKIVNTASSVPTLVASGVSGVSGVPVVQLVPGEQAALD